MLSKKFQRKVFEAHKEGRSHIKGNYEYAIQYHPCAVIHTWIVRRYKKEVKWQFLQPLNEEIKLN